MRAILHVDMDAFYASVEQQDRPELRGKPIIVGGDSRRGVVAAANYEVRKFGVRSAMPTRLALQLCPSAIVVPPRMSRYREVSAVVFQIFGDFTPMIEGLSLDEAFLDVTASQTLFGDPVVMARTIKARVKAQTGLTASVGIAHNKLLAKIASDLGKPDGLHHIEPTHVTQTLDALPVGRLPGVGPKTTARLDEAGILTFGDLRNAADSVLAPIFGRHASHMRARASGLDDRPVLSDVAEQQISAEETFDQDLKTSKQVRVELARLVDRVGIRLRRKQMEGSAVSIKVRRSDFSTYTRTRSFEPPTADSGTLLVVAQGLLERWFAEQPDSAVRLLGVGVGALVPATQLDLFGASANGETGGLSPPDPVRVSARIDPALDEIRARFGDSAVRRASSLDRSEKNDGFTGVRRR
jgi:DNA polymerase-4